MLASATLARGFGESSASANSARARIWGSRSGDTNDPSLSNVNIVKTERSTASGRPFSISTMTSALRTR
jgi:hypothetical protein